MKLPPIEPPRVPAQLAELGADDLSDEATVEDGRLEGVDLTGAQLDGLTLSGCVLHGVSLTGASLTALHLTDCVLDDCELSGATLEAASLRRVRFERCRMAGFTAAELQRRPRVLRRLPAHRVVVPHGDARALRLRGLRPLGQRPLRGDDHGVAVPALEARRRGAVQGACSTAWPSTAPRSRASPGPSALRGCAIGPDQVVDFALPVLASLGHHHRRPRGRRRPELARRRAARRERRGGRRVGWAGARRRSCW